VGGQRVARRKPRAARGELLCPAGSSALRPPARRPGAKVFGFPGFAVPRRLKALEFVKNNVSCLITSLGQSYPILSYPILSYPILSYPILSYPILSFLFYAIYLPAPRPLHTRCPTVAKRTPSRSSAPSTVTVMSARCAPA
jgi:hypothetical protein